MIHDELVERARKWLRGTMGCNPVYCERGSMMVPEIPDAIGFTVRASIVVECKTSREDLNKDHYKVFRKYPELGMGNLRYYLCEPELIMEPMVSNVGWGLLWINGKRIRLIVKSDPFQANLIAERRFLRSRIVACQYAQKWQTPLKV